MHQHAVYGCRYLQGVRECNTITVLNNRRHFFKVNLMHDAVTRRDHINIFKRRFSPVYKMKTVIVAAVFNGAVLSQTPQDQSLRAQQLTNGQQSAA